MARNGQHPLTVASAGFALFLACQLALHARNLHDWPRHISSFVYESWGSLWTLGLVAVTVALAALAYAASTLLPRTPEARWAVASLVVAAASTFLMAAFPTDVTDYPSTPSGYVHDFAAVAAVTFQCATMFFTVLAGRADPLWRLAAGESPAWPWVASALGVAWSLGDLTPFWRLAALVQRLLCAVMAVWLLALAWRVRVEVLAPALPLPVQGPQRAR
jgi:cytochrome c biogenesis protein CcdA